MLICTIKNNLQFELWHQMLQQISLGQITCSFHNLFSRPQLKIISLIYPKITSLSLLS